MTRFARFLPALGLVLALLGAFVAPVFADSDDPLFVNLTTDDAHRAKMALDFGNKQMQRGHPLTVFLNDRGVFLASLSKAAALQEQQTALVNLIGNGATVIVCPMCMKHYGVAESDLIPGAQVGNPELTGNALFKDDTQTMTW